GAILGAMLGATTDEGAPLGPGGAEAAPPMTGAAGAAAISSTSTDSSAYCRDASWHPASRALAAAAPISSLRIGPLPVDDVTAIGVSHTGKVWAEPRRWRDRTPHALLTSRRGVAFKQVSRTVLSRRPVAEPPFPC